VSNRSDLFVSGLVWSVLVWSFLRTNFLVEVDIVLPEDMPLRQAHDIGESLQLVRTPLVLPLSRLCLPCLVLSGLVLSCLVYLVLFLSCVAFLVFSPSSV
jgi:hypothetical protein